MKRAKLMSAVFFGVAVVLVRSQTATRAEDIPETLDCEGPCCSVSHCYGDSQMAIIVIPGGYWEQTDDAEYYNVTLGANATWNTCGHELRVEGTLTIGQNAEVTDQCNGGEAGLGGTAGVGGHGCIPHVAATAGGPGGDGREPPPDYRGKAGNGGPGGGGGGGGGGAWDTLAVDADDRNVPGGDGGAGGSGGKGGGYVRIYAYNLDNHGHIHADGEDAHHGGDGEEGDLADDYPVPPYLRDASGGGGGGGGGGDGGDGGRVEVYYVNLINLGEIHAAGGECGFGGERGGSQCGELDKPARLGQYAEYGAPGGPPGEDPLDEDGCGWAGGGGESDCDVSCGPTAHGYPGQPRPPQCYSHCSGVDGAVFVIQDCNCNGLLDQNDVAGATSEDCQPNGIPDECDIDCGDSEDCNINMVPDECDLLEEPDCNGNGILDECELIFTACSPEPGPIGDGSPQSLTIPCPPEAVGEVTLVFSAFADLAAASEFIAVEINGWSAGVVFDSGADDCPLIRDVAKLDILAEDFNNAVNGSNALINMVASGDVSPTLCGPTSCITVCVVYTADEGDCNENSVPDDCDVDPSDPDGDGYVSEDCQPNSVPDECEVLVGGSYEFETGMLTPFQDEWPADICLPASPPATADVTLKALVSADLDSGSEYVDVYLDGDWVGQLFTETWRQCPGDTDGDKLTIPQAVFNDALPGGITITLEPSPAVQSCAGAVQVWVTYPAGSPDCNGNGVPDDCDVAQGTSPDCNENGIPDECELEGRRFPIELSDNTTGYDDFYFIGPPDDFKIGIGGQWIIYEFDCGFVENLPGPDFNVYELDQGSPEFETIDVLVSDNGVDFVSVKSSEGSVVGIPGDENHGNTDYARSYNLSASGLPGARYIRIDGNGSGPAGPATDFDLDAVGAIHITNDCNDNSVPDDCDIAGGTCSDHNGNGICDQCEEPARLMAEDCSTIGSSPTCNNGTTSCSVSLQNCPPGLEPCTFTFPGTRCQNDPSVPCALDADCRNQSICVPPPADQPELGSVCYAPKTRYLSIVANPAQLPGTARRVKLDVGWCEDVPILSCTTDQDCIDAGVVGPCTDVLGWVGEPYVDGSDVHGSYIVAEVVAEADRHYAEAWPDILHVHTCEIAHASLCEDTGGHCKPNNCPGHPVEQCINHRYGIQAIVAGEDIEDEEAYSEPLWLNTADTWGDTVGGCGGNICDPANGLPGLDDIMAAIGYFAGCQDVAPLPWLDIDPSNLAQCPEQIVGLGDIMAAIAGFQGAAYPGSGPKECP